jgi:hypothetical protein
MAGVGDGALAAVPVAAEARAIPAPRAVAAVATSAVPAGVGAAAVGAAEATAAVAAVAVGAAEATAAAGDTTSGSGATAHSPRGTTPAMAKPGKGRILRATFGCNPNSSSLGVDVTFLLFGATFASAIALVLGALLRGSDAPPPAARPPPAGAETARSEGPAA